MNRAGTPSVSPMIGLAIGSRGHSYEQMPLAQAFSVSFGGQVGSTRSTLAVLQAHCSCILLLHDCTCAALAGLARLVVQ
jgi:hypothetical protein